MFKVIVEHRGDRKATHESVVTFNYQEQTIELCLIANQICTLILFDMYSYSSKAEI